MIFTIGTQNMTEGPVTDDLHKVDIAFLQEIDRKKLRAGFDRNKFGIYISSLDPHQAIVWRKGTFLPTQKGWLRFHRSAETELDLGHDNWEGIKSPARGMLWMRGYLPGVMSFNGDPKQPQVFSLFDLWLLNSWNPMELDRFSAARRAIVEELALPKIKDKIRDWHDEGAVIFGGGDGNSMKWTGKLPGLTCLWNGDLDRQWYDERFARVMDRFEGAITGVGPDRKHASKIAEYKLNIPKR